MEHRTEEIGGRRCEIWSNGQGGAVLYWGIAQGDEMGEAIAARMAERLGETSWTLVAHEAENWNQAYSPWALLSTEGGAEFSGSARETLTWLTQACMAQVEGRMPGGAASRLIGGYSLSGLFSLFAFYESGLFDGVASCSGSLWYPGWKEYALGRSAPKGSCVYLSLGRKEEKTRSRRMAAVGDMTRWQNEQVLGDKNVRASELVWHNGGHFTDVDQRIAQGFAWLIQHAQR